METLAPYYLLDAIASVVCMYSAYNPITMESVTGAAVGGGTNLDGRQVKNEPIILAHATIEAMKLLPNSRVSLIKRTEKNSYHISEL